MRPERDPGLQPERTSLAWLRTCLAVAVNAILLLRAGSHREDLWLISSGIVMVAIAMLLAYIGQVRRKSFSASIQAPPAVAMGIAAAAVFIDSCAVAYAMAAQNVAGF